MMPIPPLANSIAQTPQAVQQVAAERAAQVRQARERERTTGRDDQPADEYIESADAVAAVGNDRPHEEPAGGRRRKRKLRTPVKADTKADEADEAKHIDLKA